MVSENSYRTKINRNPTSAKYGREVYVKNGDLASDKIPWYRTVTNPTSSRFGQQERIKGTPSVGSFATAGMRSAAKYIGISKTSSPSAIPGAQTFSEPEPDQWEVVRTETFPNACVAEIRYPNCTNYEGRKILVFKVVGGFSAVMKKNKGLLDPHFFEGADYISPLARFEPTSIGWSLATTLAKGL